MNKVDDAIKAYDDEIKADDSWVWPWIEQGKLYLQQGKTEEARKDLRKAHDMALSDTDEKAHTEVLKLMQQLEPDLTMPAMPGMDEGSGTPSTSMPGMAGTSEASATPPMSMSGMSEASPSP
jgi:tetratricopeptide (TPR) repeat protein